jgi:hypothetical protein
VNLYLLTLPGQGFPTKDGISAVLVVASNAAEATELAVALAKKRGWRNDRVFASVTPQLVNMGTPGVVIGCGFLAVGGYGGPSLNSVDSPIDDR